MRQLRNFLLKPTPVNAVEADSRRAVSAQAGR
jgi:hypothetical protein